MITIGAKEADRIREWNVLDTQPVSLRFVKTTDARSKHIESFLEALARMAPRVSVVTEKGGEEDLPGFYVGKAVHYHAVPVENELAPFLEMLSLLNTSRQELPLQALRHLEALQLPAELKLYVTPQCPFCPGAIREIVPLSFANPLLEVKVIDGLLFPELAGRDGIRSVPTLILDDQLRWTGSMDRQEILEALVHRDPSRLSAKALKEILKDGSADRLARMMLEQNCIFPSFPDLLSHPDWSVRLGAMVVVEELADQNPKLALELAPLLWERIEDVDGPARGDMISIFGLLGSKEYIPRLENLLTAENDEGMREVVEDTLERLRAPSI